MKWVPCAVVALAVQANAGLIAHEGFDYADGVSLNLQNGGFGFSSAWTNEGSGVTVSASAPGFTYSGAESVGNKVYLEGAAAVGGNVANSYRDLSSTMGADSTTVWFSLMGQRINNASTRYFNFAFFNGGSEGLAIGEPSANAADLWSLRVNAAPAVMSNSTVSIYSQAFLLVRIDFGAADSDTAWMWANPDLSLGEPATGTAEAYITGRNMTFNRYRLSAGGAQTGNPQAMGYFDELRLGDTYLDVIPEPATGLLAAVGMAFLALRRRPCR